MNILLRVNCSAKPFGCSILVKQQSRAHFNYPCPRKLREIMKMSLIERETTEKIKNIWSEYHNDKPRCFADVVDGEMMTTVLNK